MEIYVEAVTGLAPSTYARRPVVLNPDKGCWGESLKVTTSTGARYTVKENEAGNLELRLDSHHTPFINQPHGNVVEIMHAPMFAPHVFPADTA